VRAAQGAGVHAAWMESSEAEGCASYVCVLRIPGATQSGNAALPCFTLWISSLFLWINRRKSG